MWPLRWRFGIFPVLISRLCRIIFLSEQLVSYLESKNIDTNPILYQGERIGLYYLPKGKDLKNAGVIYDRNNSAFAGLTPGMIDWDQVFCWRKLVSFQRYLPGH